MNYQDAIQNLINCRAITVGDLKSLLGHLNWATCVLSGAQAFFRCLYDIIRGPRIPHRKTSLDDKTVAYLALWAVFLDQYNEQDFIHVLNKSDSISLNFVNGYKSGSQEDLSGVGLARNMLLILLIVNT